MTIKTDDEDSSLDQALAGPLLDVPDGFAARVMAALPARSRRRPPQREASRAWRGLQASILAACGALGAAEVMLFVCGLWTTTVVGMG